MILLVNQHTVPVFTDVVNAFADTCEDVVLFTGHIEKGGRPLSSRVKVVSSLRYNRRTSFSRLLTWMAFGLHYLIYVLLSKKPSKILVVTNPPIAPILTMWASKLRSIPFYALIYDLYPEALVQTGLMQRSNFIYRFWQKLNTRMFAHCIKVFTLSDSMKLAVSIYMGSALDKIKVIHNWADTSYIYPVVKSENPFVKKHHLQNKRVVLYAGNMGLTHDLESLVKAAGHLADMPEIAFILIGDGAKRTSLEKLKSEKLLHNVFFLPYQDADNFPLAMAAADIGVVTLGEGAEGISVPSKTYINLAAGLCLLVIAPATSELSRLVNENEVGVTCEPGNALQVAETLRTLVTNTDKLDEYKVKALRTSAKFTSHNAVAYVKEIFAQK